jgi:hypothetical protein
MYSHEIKDMLGQLERVGLEYKVIKQSAQSMGV